ncbi:hypothetical protein D0429_07715 [Staphylococcus auricularis]|uniref:Uncharacterized protein n=1 Tax=Staphylococcus auricularis TaxID=29379 RepID=A0AAP8PP40_9STAP|nr:hypothetical protein [Staphylococcus auricularis]PNZ67721.1 hypothetical protein CD158_05445 [Staphylococcus auricularis]
MPKSQQIILAIFLVLLGFNVALPLIGAYFQIELLQFDSILVKALDGITILIAIVFVYRQIKRKGI